MNPVVFSGPAHTFALIEERKAEFVAQGRRLHDFSVGDPLEPTPDFIRQALIDSLPEVSQYPSASGTASLRQAIARYADRRFGVSLDPESEIIACSGAKEAVFHLPFALVDRGSSRRAIVWGEPSYPVYERGAAYAGAEGVGLKLRPERGFLLEPDDVPVDVLERTVLFWINTPHNPTGATADRAYLERVADASRRHGFVVASDETYADLYWDTPPPSMLEVMRDNVIVIHSLSKRSGMTGFRSGFIAGDEKIIAGLNRMRPSVGVASQVFVQAAAEVAWSDDGHVAERRRLFADKKRRVVELCTELGLETLPSGGGLYVWFRAPDDDSLAYSQKLLTEGVLVTPGEIFGSAGAGWVRVALAPRADEFDEALQAWRKAHG